MKIVEEKTARNIQGRLRQSRKFVFDDEATTRVAEVVRDIPDLIVRESRFARAPFDLTWIEYQARTYWETITGKKDTDRESDKRIGILVDHNKINVIVEGGDGAAFKTIGRLCVYPIAYHLNTEWSLEDQIIFADYMDVSPMTLDLWMWGSTANRFLESGDIDRLRLLRATNSAEYIGNPKHFSKELAGDLIAGARGDMRTFIAFLLMLNRPSIVHYRHTLPNHTGFIGNKVRPFMSHTSVSIDLDAVSTLRLIGTPAGEGIARRRHEVRGHYCHDQTARDYRRIAGCEHTWQSCNEHWILWPDASPDAVDHWICKNCGGKRWWRKDHERGTAEAGFVDHVDYAVTSRKER